MKSQIRILQEQNSFIKSELHQKQIIIQKPLDINKNRIKNNCPSNGINKVTKKGKVKKIVVILQLFFVRFLLK